MANNAKTLASGVLIITSAFGGFPTVAGGQSASITSDQLASLHFRNIGPSVTGGRIHDVEALPNDPSTIYVAASTGGLWKSTNNGTTWRPIFDDKPVSTFGDLDIAPSDPNIIWAGTGEQNNRQSTSWGNGIYVSTDGGDNWDHRGLADTRHIARVVIHPKNPSTVYVGALGDLWKGSDARGVYKTTDSGISWEKVLFIDEYTGVIDMVMDTDDPSTLYAATYQRLRRTWGFNGGGPGSGIYKTTDGGKTWNELTNGIPEGNKGRIGLSMGLTGKKSLYAVIDHEEKKGVYRSTDRGDSWMKVNKLNPRPMYYSHIFVDPTNDQRVYLLATEFYRSDDGGTTFRQMPTRPVYDVGVHSDHHTLWIDPNNPEHFFLAGDAGLHRTWDGGETYSHINNFPIGQIYGIGVDMRNPYFVYIGMQDTHSWMGPSAVRRFIGIVNDDWAQIGFGDGDYQQPDPTNPRYVYSNSQNGNLTRVDSKTGDILGIRPFPEDEKEEYRFDWVTPSAISKHDPKTVYFGGNKLFISHNRGNSWTATADLTTQTERDSLFLMGVQGKDIAISKNDGTSSYGEITTIGESPLDRKILWIGTDDGNVQVSRDRGNTWTEVAKNISGLPKGSYVSRVIASVRSRSTAYATFDAHRDGDVLPYVYRSSNFGESWESLTKGLPEDGSVNVIVEHPANPNLLFLGTEHGLFISTTAGAEWVKFESLPTTLYDDLVIHPRENDLIVATHGRSVYILDDLAPLVKWSASVNRSKAHLFPIRAATMFHYWKSSSYRSQSAFNGENPVFGAILSYYLDVGVDSVEFIIRNKKKQIVRRLTAPGNSAKIARINWDLRHEPPPFRDEDEEEEGLVKSKNILPAVPRTTDPVGPFVSPGTYTVTLIVGDSRSEQTVAVGSDPDMPIAKMRWRQKRKFRKREEFLLGVRELQQQAWDLSDRAKAAQEFFEQTHDSLKALEGLAENVLKHAEVQADTAKARASRVKELREEIYLLAGEFNGRSTRQGSMYPPTKTHTMRKHQLKAKLKKETEGIVNVEAWTNE